MLKQVYITSAGIFEDKSEAFKAEWKVVGGKRFLRLFNEFGVEIEEVEQACAALYRSERAHNLVKDYLNTCGWTEKEGNTSKRGIVYGMGFATECFFKNID